MELVSPDTMKLISQDKSELVKPVRLLVIPSEECDKIFDVFDAYGDYAGAYGDNGGDPDGDGYYAPVSLFPRHLVKEALKRGARIERGWKFTYRYNPEHEGIFPSGWCGYSGEEEGYALDRRVALLIAAFNQMVAQAEELE